MSSSEMMGVETPENLNENEITEGNDGVEGTSSEGGVPPISDGQFFMQSTIQLVVIPAVIGGVCAVVGWLIQVIIALREVKGK